MPTKIEVEAELARVKREYETFRTQVQERIQEAIADGEICESGGNDALELFGLEPAKKNYRLRFNVDIALDNFEVTPDRYGDFDTYDVQQEIQTAIETTFHRFAFDNAPGATLTVNDVEYYDADEI